jgi:predicted MFS family arabinose efflux permease
MPVVRAYRGFFSGRTPAEVRSARRYVVEFALAGGAFVVLSFLADALASRLDGPARTASVLLPSLGAAAMAFAVVRFALRMDERQRQTVVTAAALAAVATALLTMALGLLQDARIVGVSLTSVLPMLALFWGLALMWLQRSER